MDRTGVSAAAAAALIAVDLLKTVLETVVKRGGPDGHLACLFPAVADCEGRIKRGAESDVAAYGAFMAARRSHASPEEIAHRFKIVLSSPVESARCTLSALELCAEAAPLIRGAVAADLATAALLVEASVRAMLLCAATNLRAQPDAALSAECKGIESRATASLAAVMAAQPAS